MSRATSVSLFNVYFYLFFCCKFTWTNSGNICLFLSFKWRLSFFFPLQIPLCKIKVLFPSHLRSFTLAFRLIHRKHFMKTKTKLLCFSSFLHWNGYTEEINKRFFAAENILAPMFVCASIIRLCHMSSSICKIIEGERRLKRRNEKKEARRSTRKQHEWRHYWSYGQRYHTIFFRSNQNQG